MSGEVPVFQFSEGAFHRTVHEQYSSDSAEPIDIKSFNTIESLRYSDSL
jgi:hypothetical protein